MYGRLGYCSKIVFKFACSQIIQLSKSKAYRVVMDLQYLYSALWVDVFGQAYKVLNDLISSLMQDVLTITINMNIITEIQIISVVIVYLKCLG